VAPALVLIAIEPDAALTLPLQGTLRAFNVATPEVIYAAADQMADFGTLPAEISIAVSQVSATEGPGLTALSGIHVGP
jgi:hypothetical protein